MPRRRRRGSPSSNVCSKDPTAAGTMSASVPLDSIRRRPPAMQRFSDVPTPHAGPTTMRGTMRSRRILLMLAVVSCLTLTTRSALAQPVPSIADQPAATLLLPYFEVDLANPSGANTLFTVNNASASAVLAHVTIWSTMHVTVYAFNVYLTGYDAKPMYVRDLLSGVLPRTASAGQDPTDAISP